MESDSNSGGAPNRGKGIVIRTFSSRMDADLAAAQLEANGIACWTAADDGGGFIPNFALSEGVRVFVAESDAEAARELLNLPPSTSDPGPSTGQNDPAITNSHPRRFALGQILIGVILGVLGTMLYQHPFHSRTETYDHYGTDGKIDETWIYVNGHRRKHMRDRNHDGKFDVWSYYDSSGELQRSEYDNNFDGKPDEWWFHTNGNLVRMERDSDFNGVPDEFCTYSNEIIEQVDVRPNGSAFTTVREFFVNGVLSEVQRGGDRNGHFMETVKYDPFLEPISTNFDASHLLSVPSGKDLVFTNHWTNRALGY